MTAAAVVNPPVDNSPQSSVSAKKPVGNHTATVKESVMAESTPRITAAAVEKATYEAALDLMDAAGHYPVTRSDVLTAIETGVHRAIAEWLDANGLPPVTPRSNP